MVIVRVPLRLSFGGGGTDLAAYYRRFGGFVLSTTITRYCYVVATRPADGGIGLNSADYRCWECYRRGELPAVEEPLALPKAAIAWFARQGLRERGVDLFTVSQVAPGTGLGGSSAMAVALGCALAAYLGRALSAQEAAELACWIEIERLGMPIGCQDQYASAFGGLNTIEFCDDGIRVTPLRLPADTVDALQERLLLFATGQSHNSAHILDQQRSDSHADPAVIAALHEIKALAVEMRDALLARDLDGFGDLLDRGWQCKKRLSRRISSGAIDSYYMAAREAGARGGKITGAGGGGFLLLYCPVERQEALRAAMARLRLCEMIFAFDTAGATVLADRPDALAQVERSMRECHAGTYRSASLEAVSRPGA